MTLPADLWWGEIAPLLSYEELCRLVGTLHCEKVVCLLLKGCFEWECRADQLLDWVEPGCRRTRFEHVRELRVVKVLFFFVWLPEEERRERVLNACFAHGRDC